MVSLPVVLEKPGLGEPCNGCGVCCRVELCVVGELVHGRSQLAPCPSLVFEGGRFWCQVVLVMPELGARVGVGEGCCCDC